MIQDGRGEGVRRREADARHFAESVEDSLPDADVDDLVPMFRPVASKAGDEEELGRDPTGLETLMAKDKTLYPLVTPADRALGKRAVQGGTRKVETDRAWRRYEAARARDLARVAAGEKLPILDTPQPAPYGPRPAPKPLVRALVGRSAGDIPVVVGEGSPLAGFLRDVEDRATHLARAECRRLDQAWIEDHAEEIWQAAGEGKPWWATESPWATVTAEHVEPFLGLAEKQIAEERRPDDPARWLRELLLPAVEAAAKERGKRPGLLVQEERKRIDLLFGARPADTLAAQGRPKCSTVGCLNDVESAGGGYWRKKCSACRQELKRSGQQRPAKNVKRVNRRKGRER